MNSDLEAMNSTNSLNRSHSLNRAQRREKINRTVLLSLLSSLAVILFIVESAIPNPVPYLRLGLANIVIMVVIALYGLRDGLWVSFLRSMVGSLLIGTFLGPSFWLSISGGLVSTLAMGLMYRLFFPFFSLVGISVVGAYVHSLTQMVLVFVFLIKRKEIFCLLPVILMSCLISGFINGLAATFLVEHLRKVRPINLL